MAQKPPETQRTARARSPSPEYYIDLTADSPLNLRTRRLNQHVPSGQPVEANPGPCSNSILPPKKRSRHEKSGKVKAIVDLDDVVHIRDSVSEDSSILSCPICFEHLTSGRKPTSTRCGHIYCSECIEETLLRSKKCPTCNVPITKKSCIRLYF